MQVVVTAIHRDHPRGDDGLVHVVDWSTKEVLHRFAPPPALMEEFPRPGAGGVRGYRGVCFVGDLCYIASADSLYGYDRNWELQHTVSHPLFSDLHEIAWDGASFWVTSTGVDAVLQVAPNEQLISGVWFGELPAAERAGLDLTERRVDRRIDHRRTLHPMRGEHIAHPNGIQIVDGRPCVTLYNQGAVVALDPLEIIWADRALHGSHSGRLRGDLLHIAASFDRSLLTVDLKRRTVSTVAVHEVVEDQRAPVRKALQNLAMWIDARSNLARSLAARAPSWLNPRPQSNRPGWTRGLCLLDGSRVLLGSSPASVYEIDTEAGVIVDQLTLSDRVEHSVFAVEVDPRIPR